MTVKNSNLGPPEPIYPPDKNRAIIYFLLSILTFFLAAIFGGFTLTLIVGTALLTIASAHLGEQHFKAKFYKEILYYRSIAVIASLAETEVNEI